MADWPRMADSRGLAVLGLNLPLRVPHGGTSGRTERAALLSTCFRWGYTWVPWFFMLSGFVLTHAALRRLSRGGGGSGGGGGGSTKSNGGAKDNGNGAKKTRFGGGGGGCVGGGGGGGACREAVAFLRRRTAAIYPLYALGLLLALLINWWRDYALPRWYELLAQAFLAQARRHAKSSKQLAFPAQLAKDGRRLGPCPVGLILPLQWKGPDLTEVMSASLLCVTHRRGCRGSPSAPCSSTAGSSRRWCRRMVKVVFLARQ